MPTELQMSLLKINFNYQLKNMFISRASIHHTILTDLKSFGLSHFSSTCLEKADTTLRSDVQKQINKIYHPYKSILYPYARTSFYATLKHLNLSEGDQILMTPFNVSPMLDIIQSLKLKPVFIDINLEDFGPKYNDLEKYLSKKPSCFFLTYLFGYVPNMDLIMRLCTKYNVPLIEDFSQNIGASYKGRLLGTFGTVSFYSASITKFVDGYNGSFLLTKDELLFDKIHSFSTTLKKPSKSRLRKIIRRTLIWNLALNQFVFIFLTYPLLFLIRIFRRSLFNKILGPSIQSNKSLNYELPSYFFEDISKLQAKALSRLLKKINKKISLSRSYATKFLNAFENLNLINNYPTNRFKFSEEDMPTFWRMPIEVKNLNLAREVLFNNGIETGPTLLPNLSERYSARLINAEKLKKNILLIPLHSHISEKTYQRILKILVKKNQIGSN